jgi:hypothetical protein
VDHFACPIVIDPSPVIGEIGFDDARAGSTFHT